MNHVAGTIELLSGELARVFEPLGQRLEDDSTGSLLEWLGLRLPDTTEDSIDLTKALTNSVMAAAKTVELVDDLAQAINQEDAEKAFSASASLLEEIGRVIQSSRSVANAIQSLSTSAIGLSSEQRTELSSFAGEFVKRLLNRLFVEYLETRFPQITVLLLATGGIEISEEQGGAADSLIGAYTHKAFHFDRTAKLFTDPSGLLREVYGWGDAGFDGITLFTVLQTLLERFFEIPAQLILPPGGPAILEAFGFNAEVNNTLNPPGLDISLRFPASASRTETITAEDWLVAVTTEANFHTDLQVTLRPLFDVELDLPTGAADILLKVEIVRTNTAAPLLLLGSAAGSRLEVQKPSAGVELEVHFDSSNSRLVMTPEFQVGLGGGKLVISGEGSDSFISSLLSGVNLESNFDIDLIWNSNQGLTFVGSAAIEIKIPAHVSIGPLDIISLYLRATIASDGSLPIELSSGFAIALGPLRASVDRLGITVTFTVPDDGGNLGPVNAELDFKPPNGVGLSIDAGAVKGGGYLFFDFDREEYAGALELVFSEWIELKAIGLITTKMPDGSKGFSLLVIITVEFGSGIQLGFGFTLLGVGGLLGLNRITKIEPLKEGIRTGAIESVMFPQDVVANAPRIISDLKRFFPPQQDIFLVGPMAKIGWGTPTLISVSLGVILEFPSVNITILGVIKVVLPDEEADILRLQVNFIGRLEPSNKLIWFYAELFDSRVLFITLEGGMGLLVNWGDNANFVVSVGGFHPRYSPPPLPFPEPPRIAANILNESYARVRIEGYFAVTSNSVQFGARVEIFFGLSEFKIEGHLAFDTLFQFDPFFFTFSLSFDLSVKVFGIGLFSVGFSGLLEGPTPWHIKGKGKISLFFFSISVPFEHTWGENKETRLDPIRVFPLLEKEFNALTNWEAVLPTSSNILVSLRKLGEADTDQLVLHPVGKLRIGQRKIPLDFKLDKVGNQRPSDVHKVSVNVTIPGGSNLFISQTEEKFAIGQFKDLDDANRLSSPAFQTLESGIEVAVAGEQMKTSQAVRRIIRYETIIIDNNFKRHIKIFFTFFATGYTLLYNYLFGHFLKGNAVTKSALSQHYKKRIQPFEEVIQIQPNQYSVAFNSNNKPIDASTTSFSSQAKAVEYMEQQVQNDPNLINDLHVIPNSEVNFTP